MQQSLAFRNPYFVSLCVDTSLEVARSKRFTSEPVESLEDLRRLVSLNRFWAPIVWKDGHNKKENFEAAYFMALDIDESPYSYAAVKNKLIGLGYCAVMYTTQSHQKPKSGKPPADRFRFIIPFARPILDVAVFHYNMRHWVGVYSGDNGCTSGALSFRPARDGIEVIAGGRLADWVAVPPPKPRRQSYRGTRSIPEWLAAKIQNGEPGRARHATLFHITAELSARGFNEAEAIDIVQSSPVWEQDSDDDSRRTARDGWRAGQKEG